jgi:hypothetical protein
MEKAEVNALNRRTEGQSFGATSKSRMDLPEQLILKHVTCFFKEKFSRPFG